MQQMDKVVLFLRKYGKFHSGRCGNPVSKKKDTMHEFRTIFFLRLFSLKNNKKKLTFLKARSLNDLICFQCNPMICCDSVILLRHFFHYYHKLLFYALKTVKCGILKS
jgi:hypothetical protein